MFRTAKTAAAAVQSAADSVNNLAADARATLSDVKEQVNAGAAFLPSMAGMIPAAIIGVGIVAVAALVISLVAVSRVGE